MLVRTISCRLWSFSRVCTTSRFSIIGSRRMSTGASTFTQAAVAALRKLYPEELADKSFDNTGLLLEAPSEASKRTGSKPSVLLAIDLTTAVAEEALEKKVSLVVAYHPIIFRPLKSLTFSNGQQATLLRLAAAGISVYSPHTAVDAAAGGNADWLAGLLKGARHPEPDVPAPLEESVQFLADEAGYAFHRFPRSGVPIGGTAALDASVAAVTPSGRADQHAAEAMGRLVTFDPPAPLAVLLSNLAAGLGRPKSFALALPRPGASPPLKDVRVRTAGVCAGSGGSVLAKAHPAPELLVTGEMSHHEVLAYTEAGSAVVCVGHSNSERGYLRQVMRGRVLESLRTELGKQAQGADVLVSEADVDPFGNVVMC